MPSLSQITATFFVDLINRLGVRPPPAEAFLLSNVVQPVSIVDAGISIPTIQTTQLLDGSFSAGLLTSPIAGTILADTGPLAAGTYSIFAMIGVDNAVAGGIDFILGRRNAANAAYVWRQAGLINSTSQGNRSWALTVKLLLNERIRFEELAGSTPGAQVEANIFVQLITAG
jgi:hypothetical protein